MADGLYLGKVFDPKTEQLGDEFRLNPADLTTHGIVIGMTGSGKTGLSVVLIEEAARAGIPVIVIDPKGDMGNLALAFPQLRPQDFEPWVDTDAATREGKTPAQAAESQATTWNKGIAEWGLGPSDVAGLAASRQVRILTPGSTAGIPVNLIESLEPPSAESRADAEEFRDQIDGVVSALLGLIGIKADPVGSSEYILLATLIERAWTAGQGLTLETLIGQVANPPVDKIGALPLDVVFPRADRNKLMLSLNNLLASPAMAAWREGEPIDIGRWLRTPDGRPVVNVVYTAHLDDEQRIFVTALLLNKLVSWMRRQPGTSELRCLLYMDEIFGYFPPTANPPTKKPLITLLKQARAYGLGVLLSTQNPVDLDYRGLGNMGFWAIGRLQTTQDQARIRTGIEAALADSAFSESFDSLIAGVQKRVFLVHDIHRKGPALVHSRFAMSYLRGPITRDEIERLTPGTATAGAAAPVAASSAPVYTPQAAAPAPEPPRPAPQVMAGPPPVPAPMRTLFLNRNGGNLATPYLFVKAAVRYKVARSAGEEQTQAIAFRLNENLGPVETLSAAPRTVNEAELTQNAPSGVSFAALPGYLAIDGSKGIERALKQRLDDAFSVELFYDPQSKLVSLPGETIEMFEARVENTPVVGAKRKALEVKLRAKQQALSAKKEDVKSRGFEKWASLGTSILSNMSILTGRKRTVTGVGGVLSKQRMEGSARNQVEKLEAEVAQIESDLESLGEVDPTRFESRTVKPASTDISILRYDILWVT
ncbi:MAG: ATP-binding protein [Dehalococcoidia bacterium]